MLVFHPFEVFSQLVPQLLQVHYQMEFVRLVQFLCLLPHHLLTNLPPIKLDSLLLLLLWVNILSELFDIKFRGLFDSEVFFEGLFLRLLRVFV